ncbi:MAG: polysaccharide biosynthesis protein [Eubacteriales bacterium]
MVDHKKQSVLSGALVLSVGVVAVTIIGLFYKMSLTALIGGVGRGYFSSAYELYTPIYAISMAGLPIAVSRLVSENIVLNRFNDARMYFKISLRIFVFIGIVGTIVLFLLAYPYTHFAADPRNLPAVIAISPSLFFCCIMSAYRGYYEGLRNMKPTAVSQIYEAIAKLVIGLSISYAIMTAGLAQYNAGDKVFGNKVTSIDDAYSIIYPLCAAGAVLGVTVGTVIGTLYLIILYRRKGDGITRLDLANSPPSLSNKLLTKRLILTAIPMATGALVLNITNLIDTVTIQARLAYAISANPGFIKNMYAGAISAANVVDKDIAKYLWGIYGSSLDFKSLMPMIIVSLGVSALPALSAAWATHDMVSAKATIETVLRVTMLVALPAGIGIAILATPILTLIYGRGLSANIIPIAAPLVAIFGYATALMSVSTPITNMLQAIGRSDIPLKSLIIGATVKIICNFVLVGTPRYNIKGAPFGSICCYIIIVGINLFYLLKLSKVRPNLMSVLFKPLISAILSGVSAKLSYGFLFSLLSSGNASASTKIVAIATVSSIAISIIVFTISILLIRGITREDISVLPKGEKIAKVLDKYRLLG